MSAKNVNPKKVKFVSPLDDFENKVCANCPKHMAYCDPYSTNGVMRMQLCLDAALLAAMNEPIEKPSIGEITEERQST
jgi:hypothetical protein